MRQVGTPALPGWTPVPALVPDQAALQRLLDERMDRLTVQLVRPPTAGPKLGDRGLFKCLAPPQEAGKWWEGDIYRISMITHI